MKGDEFAGYLLDALTLPANQQIILHRALVGHEPNEPVSKTSPLGLFLTRMVLECGNLSVAAKANELLMRVGINVNDD